MALFKRHMRMTYDSFSKLLLLINDNLKDVVKEIVSKRGGEVIKELHLYATLQYMAGASYSDITFFCGISVSTFFRILWETIDAINANPFSIPILGYKIFSITIYGIQRVYLMSLLLYNLYGYSMIIFVIFTFIYILC